MTDDRREGSFARLREPLTGLEKAELSAACRKFLAPSGMMLLRRLMFQTETQDKRIAELEADLDAARAVAAAYCREANRSI